LLRALTQDHALVAALQRDDWTLAALDQKDRALLDFARKLNSSPSEMRLEDVDRLRAAGFTDETIFDIVAIVAFFNFINRIADGLGVVPESELQESYERHMEEVIMSGRSLIESSR